MMYFPVHKLQYDYLAEKAFQWRNDKFHFYVFGNVFHGIVRVNRAFKNAHTGT